MNQDINLFIALAAGLVSFLSPCILPLIPSYLTVMGAWGRSGSTEPYDPLETSGLGGPSHRIATSFGGVIISLGFVLGFSVVFILLGLGAGLVTGPVAGPILSLVAGMVVIIMGLHLGFGLFTGLYRELRVHVAAPRVEDQEESPPGRSGFSVWGGFLRALPMGAAFGAGWTPCIGPMLAAILALAGSSEGSFTGAGYLAAYSLGLGLPFIAAAAGTQWFSGFNRRLRPYLGWIQRGSGFVMIGLGVLIATGRFQRLTGWIVGAGYRMSGWVVENTLEARVLGTGILVVIALGFFALWWRRRAVWRLVFALGFLVIGILNALGSISILGGFAAWFQFQGI